MKKLIVFILLIALAAICVGGPTSVNVSRNPTADWFSSGGTKDLGMRWIREADELLGYGLGLGTGNIYYVDSGVTTEGDGTSWESAKDTLDEGVGLCTASRGDIILVAQGHNEALTAADGVDADIAGITVIGIGQGSLKPTFDYDQSAGEFVIGADNVTLYNLRFRASTSTITGGIDVETGCDYATIQNCDFVIESSTDEFARAIKAATNTEITVRGCLFDAGAATAVAAIALDGPATGAFIEDNVIRGDYSTANIIGSTVLSTNVLIRDNVLFNGTIGGDGGLNAQPVIEMLTGSCGIVANNYMACNVDTVPAATVFDKAFFFGNWYIETDDAANTAIHLGSISSTASVTVEGDG